jgi:hypothetical protein
VGAKEYLCKYLEKERAKYGSASRKLNMVGLRN